MIELREQLIFLLFIVILMLIASLVLITLDTVVKQKVAATEMIGYGRDLLVKLIDFAKILAYFDYFLYLCINKDIKYMYNTEKYNNIGTTWRDYLDNKWVRLSDAQIAFHKANPNATSGRWNRR